MAFDKFILKDATIVNEGHIFNGSLLVSQGKIEKIFRNGLPESISQSIQVIDLSGLVLLPGVIDDQVHFRDPGLTHKGDLNSESRAAVAGGITSFMEMPNTLPKAVTQKELEAKFKLGQEKSLANFSFYMGTTNDNLDEVLATDPKNVCGIKVFMGASTGNMLVDNPGALSGIFRHARLPVAVHCEDEATIAANLALAIEKYGHDIPVSQHPIIRNHEACLKSSTLAVNLAKKHGTRLHVLHLSTAHEMALFENTTPLKDKQITAEACLHHLWFTDTDYEQRGSLIKWNPAIKTLGDREALRQALISGLIDVVATDHAPHTLQEKQNPYLQCPSGAPLVQHFLPAMLEMVHQKVFTLQQVVTWMSHNPAIIFGVKNRGFIREGYAADFAVVNLNQPQTVIREESLYKCGWSPLEGIRFNSSVVYTFVNGVTVFEKGVIRESVKGQTLIFDR